MVAGEMPRPITQVTSYHVSCLPPDHPDAREFTLEVCQYEREDGDFWWAVKQRGGFYDEHGERSWGFAWPGQGVQYEPVTDDEHDSYDRARQEWLEAHRFTEAEALALARRLAPKLELHGHTVKDALDKMRKNWSED